MRFLLFIFLCLASVAHATTYYVRTDGHDGANGQGNTSNATTGAWLTSNYAFNNTAVVAGDTVRFQAGTYAGLISRTNKGNGTAGNPITFTCDGTVIVDCITINSDDYLTLHGFEITTAQTPADMNPTTYAITGGIVIYTTDNLVIEDCYIHDIPAAGIFFSGSTSQLSSNMTVQRNRIRHVQNGMWMYSADTGAATWSNNIITELQHFVAQNNYYDIDYCVMKRSHNATITGQVEYGTTEDETIMKGTCAASGSTGNTILATIDASTCYRRVGTNGIASLSSVWNTSEKLIKNMTTGATGLITADTHNITPGTQCLITATMTGGSRQNWASGDVWYTAAYPHLDGIQLYSDVVAQAVVGLVIQDCYFGDNMEAIQVENNHGVHSNWTIRRCVLGPGFPEIYQYNQPNGNAPLSSNNTTMSISNCTWFGYTYPAIFNDKANGYNSQAVTAASTITLNDCIGYLNTVNLSGSGGAPNPTLVEDYNNMFPAITGSPGTHDVSPAQNPLFVVSTPTTSSHVLGADMLFGTTDDGLRLTSSSPGKTAGTAGASIGAYQFAAGDITPPTITLVEILTNGTTLNLTFSEPVTSVSAADYTLSSGSLSSASGSAASWSMTISPTIYSGETKTLSYTAGATVDTSANPLASFSGRAVSNNSAVSNPNNLANRAKTRAKISNAVMTR